MSILDETQYCFQNALNFNERADRTEYWKFVLFIFLSSIVLVVVNSMIFGPTIETGVRVTVDSAGHQTQTLFTQKQYTSGWLGNMLSLVVLIPLVAVTVRRLHDIGKSGWWLLTPVVGIAVSFGTIYLTSTTVAIDPSRVPQGFGQATEVRVPNNVPIFMIAWLIAFGSLGINIYWLARRSSPDANIYGPNPNEVPT